MDLRHLAPPEPMIEILKRIDAGETSPLIILLPHFPVPLLPELDARGWRYEVLSNAPGAFTMKLLPP